MAACVCWRERVRESVSVRLFLGLTDAHRDQPFSSMDFYSFGRTLGEGAYGKCVVVRVCYGMPGADGMLLPGEARDTAINVPEGQNPPPTNCEPSY
eukprot:3829303-Rhodomonas_salina.5